MNAATTVILWQIANNNPIRLGNTQADEYNSAFKTFESKRERVQQGTGSAQQTKRDLACQTSGGDTFGGFNETDVSKISFALPGMNNQNDDNKQVTMVVFQGSNVTDQAEPRGNAYRTDTSKRITTPYDNYGTGPLYTIRKFTCSMASPRCWHRGWHSFGKTRLTLRGADKRKFPDQPIKTIWTRCLLCMKGIQ